MIDTIGMTDIGNGRPSNQDAYLLASEGKERKALSARSRL